MRRDAWIPHLKFLSDPMAQLGIQLESAEYYDFAANLDLKARVDNLDDVLDIVSSPSFKDQPSLPALLGRFQGQEVRLDLQIPNYRPDFELGKYDRAMVITSKKVGVLEDVLEKISQF
jgi:hypothetical protein